MAVIHDKLISPHYGGAKCQKLKEYIVWMIQRLFWRFARFVKKVTSLNGKKELRSHMERVLIGYIVLVAELRGHLTLVKKVQVNYGIGQNDRHLHATAPP